MRLRREAARQRSDEVARLTAQVQSLSARLDRFQAGQQSAASADGDQQRQSLRDLLSLPVGAARRAAGSIVLGAVPASATNFSPVILGNSTTNDAAATTDLFPTNATAPAPLLQATGQGVTTTTTVQPTASSTAPNLQSIPLIGAIGPGGSLPPIG